MSKKVTPLSDGMEGQQLSPDAVKIRCSSDTWAVFKDGIARATPEADGGASFVLDMQSASELRYILNGMDGGLDEAGRQMLVFALARLAHERPGWLEYLRQLANGLPDGQRLFERSLAATSQAEIELGERVAGS